MFTILFLLIISAAVGFMLRRHTKFESIISRTTGYTVVLLLLFFGITIRSNSSILGNLRSYGIYAAVIAFLGVAGSVCAAVLFARLNGKGGGK